MAHIHEEIHEHEHIHADGTVHSHPHTHEDDHTHPHTHTSEGEAASTDKTRALLGYMIDHNEHHAEELADLLDTLPPQAKKQLTRAIGTFEVANVELRQVLEYLDD